MLYVIEHSKPRLIRQWNKEIYEQIKVVDSTTGTSTTYTNQELYRFLRQNTTKPTVYGTDVYGLDKYNMFVFTTPLKPVLTTNTAQLQKLCESHKQRRNDTTLHPIEDYLAMLPKGIEITVEYQYTGNYDDPRVYKSKAVNKKIDFHGDKWHILDESTVYSGETGNSQTVAYYLSNSTAYRYTMSMKINSEQAPQVKKKCIWMADSLKQTNIVLDDVLSITGVYHIRRHTEYKYTARLRWVCVNYKDGRTFEFSHFGKDKTITGGGFDKVSAMFVQLLALPKEPVITPIDKSSYNTFGTHRFTITLNPVIIKTKLDSKEIV